MGVVVVVVVAQVVAQVEDARLQFLLVEAHVLPPILHLAVEKYLPFHKVNCLVAVHRVVVREVKSLVLGTYNDGVMPLPGSRLNVDFHFSRQYGSGYPGVASRGVAGLGFPFFFWPVVFGTGTLVGTGAYLHAQEVRNLSRLSWSFC